MSTAFRALLLDEEAQGLAEYGLILALVAVLCVAALGVLQGAISTLLSNMANAL